MTTTAAYSARAAEYTDLLGSMSAVHPSDRQIIESWAAQIEGDVLDAGCGPGHWTNHLNELGIRARGIDLVPSFIEHARSAYPGIQFDLQRGGSRVVRSCRNACVPLAGRGAQRLA